MTFDDLERKIIEIRKRGLNIVVQTELIANVRGEYYEKLIAKKHSAINDLFRKNINYLASLHKQKVTSNLIQETMGIQPDLNLNKVIYGSFTINNIKTAIAVAEFYGLPVDLLLFNDLEANAQTLKELYPAIFRQGRN
jgi:hypothetical protein